MRDFPTIAPDMAIVYLPTWHISGCKRSAAAAMMSHLMQPANDFFRYPAANQLYHRTASTLGSAGTHVEAAGRDGSAFLFPDVDLDRHMVAVSSIPAASYASEGHAGERDHRSFRGDPEAGYPERDGVTQAWLNNTGDPAYDCITIEHNGFASSGILTDNLWSALQDWLAIGIPAVDEFILSGIDAEQLLRGEGVPDVESGEYGYRAPLANFTTLERFMSSLSRNSRQQLRRSMRAYECKGPLTVEVARDTQSALTFFSQMRALHVSSWTRRENRHAFSNPFFETFHRSLIRHGVANGTVDLLRVSAGDQAIGYLYNFRHDGTVSSYQSGFDDVDRRLRPGYVCHALAIAHYAAAGMSSYDFLGGTNQLKQSFGPQRYELCGYRLHKKTPLFRADLLARRVVGAFRSRNH